MTYQTYRRGNKYQRSIIKHGSAHQYRRSENNGVISSISVAKAAM